MLKIAWSPLYSHPLPEDHRFPMEKYSLLPEQLLYEGTVSEDNFFVPEMLDEKWILNTHDEAYFTKLKKQNLSKAEIRATGFPLSPQLVEREIQIAGGSVQAALFAMEFGIGMNIAGGTHHAFTDRGEGFCLLNDLAITANYLLDHGYARKILIVDLDVHQGNGTAEIFRAKSEVFTFSMHGEKNYPHRKEKSDLDVGLPDGIKDTEYLRILEKNLDHILRRFVPDFILYQSGVDVLETDKLGRLGLSHAGILQRDKLVLSLAQSIQVPVMCCMGGGYSARIKDIIDAHAQVFRLAQDLFF
ncbi:histone deacetylase [Algoriphagus confluentis]|uniref:Histone deacetylase n=1 Tax=Algoriphagus confluentis TaxID=1697556 RepID=A0ABQ6PKM7_9BACT|nr:histone deacetylase [Algoriphagus confluentis]